MQAGRYRGLGALVRLRDIAMSDDRTPSLSEAAHLLDGKFPALTAPQRLARLRAEVAGRLVFTTSLGIEDQAITHMIAAAGLDIEIATLDTGRLFPETYEVWAKTEEKYGLRIKAFYPQAQAVEALVAEQGVNGFYHLVEARKACCGVRKVEPLGRALAGAAAWITGLRADQSANRQGFGFVSFEAERGLIKANPIFDWTRRKVVDFVKANEVPANVLHERGFLSIGCAPCTRAVRPGESERAGRWWWEDEDKKECGLHVADDGRLVRAPSAAAAGTSA
jgi:phosphoadenosine phosphosulfate reductase